MSGITSEKLMTFLIVLFILIEAYNTAMTAREHHRKARTDSPSASMAEKLKKHDDMLAADKLRIERLESESIMYSKEMKMLLKSQLALLRHGIDGNNIEGLKENQQEINEFLIDLK